MSSMATAAAAVSGCELSALTVAVAGVVITTRSARLLPNTNVHCVAVLSQEAVVTVVLAGTAYKHTNHA